MEALEPVLKQKFWILLGMGVIMTFTGWWMATGAMAQQTNERKAKIKSAEDGVPKGEVPNESWSKRLLRQAMLCKKVMCWWCCAPTTVAQGERRFCRHS